MWSAKAMAQSNIQGEDFDWNKLATRELNNFFKNSQNTSTFK